MPTSTTWTTAFIYSGTTTTTTNYSTLKVRPKIYYMYGSEPNDINEFLKAVIIDKTIAIIYPYV